MQVYILKRMGGMLESCHTCRLMDLEHVRGMCYHYGLSLPETLDSLCRNEIPKGRRGTWPHTLRYIPYCPRTPACFLLYKTYMYIHVDVDVNLNCLQNPPPVYTYMYNHVHVYTHLHAGHCRSKSHSGQFSFF